MKVVREEASRIVLEEQQRRQKEGEGQNSYQVGDLVLRRTEKMVDRKDKLSPVYLGPYEVAQVYKADVQCRHLVTGAISTFHMDVLKPCFSTQEEAYKAAMVDYDQFVIDVILSYRGDPDTRTKMEFEVKFADGSLVWLPYSKDLSDTIQFEEFVRANRPLQPLLYTLEAWKRLRRESHTEVRGVEPGDVCYVDLRAWGSGYFCSLGLNHAYLYVVRCEYLHWVGRGKRKIFLRCDLFDQEFTWDAWCVYSYGSEKVLGEDMVLVDKAFCEANPLVLKDVA